MKIYQLNIQAKPYPEILRAIPSPPKVLYCLGAPLAGLLEQPTVAIVGSRKVSPYGQQVTADLASQLARRGIIIVSGLALGVDCIAHKAALDAGGTVIAVLPSGLDRIYPSANHNLAKRILDGGGALISEYPVGTEPFKSNFVARNRIVSGLSRAVVITEAAEKSGSLHTANFALEQGREVCAVPGNINSPYSVGTNNLIKTGATPVTSVQDILHVIGIDEKRKPSTQIAADNEHEYIILSLINNGLTDGDELLKQSGLDTPLFNQTLTMLEIRGKVRAGGNGRWNLS